MAIRTAYTNNETGEVSPDAHAIVHNPNMDERTRQIMLRVTVYASKADYDSGKAPVREHSRTFPLAQYNALRTIILDVVEPRLITTYFPGGSRVAD